MSNYEESKRLAEMDRQAEKRKWVRLIIAGIMASILFFIGLIFLWGLVSPKLNLYRSNTEKQAVIAEQEAKSQAEVYAAEKRVIAAQADAEARIIEAKSLAEAQQIISQTLTSEYLTWRLYEVLASTENQVIYLPTEAGLPITESHRLDVPAIAPPSSEVDE